MFGSVFPYPILRFLQHINFYIRFWLFISRIFKTLFIVVVCKNPRCGCDDSSTVTAHVSARELGFCEGVADKGKYCRWSGLLVCRSHFMDSLSMYIVYTFLFMTKNIFSCLIHLIIFFSFFIYLTFNKSSYLSIKNLLSLFVPLCCLRLIIIIHQVQYFDLNWYCQPQHYLSRNHSPLKTEYLKKAMEIQHP